MKRLLLFFNIVLFAVAAGNSWFSCELIGQERFVDTRIYDKDFPNIYKKDVKGLPPWQPIPMPSIELQKSELMDIYNPYITKTEKLRSSYIDYLTSKIAKINEEMNHSQTVWPSINIIDFGLQVRELEAVKNGDYTRPVVRSSRPLYQSDISHSSKRLEFERELLALKHKFLCDVDTLVKRFENVGNWEFCYRLKEFQYKILFNLVLAEQEYRYP